MTLTTEHHMSLITDGMNSTSITDARDIRTTESKYEDALSPEYLSSGLVSWTARVEVFERGGDLLVQGTGKEPEWLQSLLRHLAELLTLERGWDSYDALPINLDTAVDAIRILLDLSGTIEFEIPSIVPTSGGGVQFEWQRPGVLIELELSPGAQPSFLIEDERRGKEFEGTITKSLEPLRTALSAQ